MKKLFRLFAVWFALSAATAYAMPAPFDAAQTASAPATAETEADTAGNAASDVVVLADPPAQATPSRTLRPSEELRRIWNAVRQDDDITVLPDQAPPPPPVADIKPEKTEKSPAKAVKPKVKVQLRTPPSPRNKGKTTAKTPAPAAKTVTVKAPPKEPVLTRRQILEREINRERNALRIAQNQLVSAKKRGNNGQVKRLTDIVKEIELNIKAITSEMVR